VSQAVVYLVGAGPGDPGLLTRRGHELLAAADCVIYDRLIGLELLELARPDAEKIFVGKEAGRHALTQDEINALLVERAGRGWRVCRLKGGDPFVFGRGGEEALACLDAGIPFEIVPGVTSSIAAPAYAGIPVTHRGIATSFAVVTGHTADDDAPPPELPRADTLVFLMGVRALPVIVARLLERGERPDKPVALVRWGTTVEQQVVTGTLATIVDEVDRSGLKPPALIVVGDVVNLREKLRWFDARPLWGRTVVVTRAREQASELVQSLKALGARVIQCPTIQVQAWESLEFEAALKQLDAQRLASGPGDAPRDLWMTFTSRNGVEHFWARWRAGGRDARGLFGVKLAAIGPATAAELELHGLVPDFVPASSISEEVAAGLVARGVEGALILLVRALEGREVLEERLTAAGATVLPVPVYRTVPDEAEAARVRELMVAGELDWVTFTSSSTVTNFLSAIGPESVLSHREGFRVACIGPVTARTAREAGLDPDVVAESPSVEALTRALRTP